MSISKEFVVSLKGKEYPLFAGVLDAATKAGLRSLRTTVLQVPAPDNGNMAVVMARAEFEDGRVFEDVGDCSPANTSPQLASASLRLASTRAKGRVLRDAINVGQTMFEELPDLDDDTPGIGAGRGSGPAMYVAEPQPRPVVTEAPRAAAPERPRPAPPRPAPAPEREAAAPAPAKNGNGTMECSNAGCGKPLTKGQHDVSLRSYGQPLCPACQKQFTRVG
jgi:hypothetical protein